MRLSDLIQTLEDIQLAVGEDKDPQILIASQPRWPMQNRVEMVELVTDAQGNESVYVVESMGNEYLASGVSEAIGW